MGAGEQTLVLGLISRFQRRKRNDVVIDAMESSTATCCWSSPARARREAALRERAARYGDRVRFAPNVRGHVEAFLSACDVLAFAPSPTEGRAARDRDGAARRRARRRLRPGGAQPV